MRSLRGHRDELNADGSLRASPGADWERVQAEKAEREKAAGGAEKGNPDAAEDAG